MLFAQDMLPPVGLEGSASPHLVYWILLGVAFLSRPIGDAMSKLLSTRSKAKQEEESARVEARAKEEKSSNEEWARLYSTLFQTSADKEKEIGALHADIHTLQGRIIEVQKDGQDRLDKSRSEWHSRCDRMQADINAVHVRELQCQKDNGDLRVEMEKMKSRHDVEMLQREGRIQALEAVVKTKDSAGSSVVINVPAGSEPKVSSAREEPTR